MLNKLLKKLGYTQYPYKTFMHKHKCVFIHIPKTAGTSILSLFDDKGPRRHLKWIDYYRADSAKFNAYHSFAIVRHPLARLYSAYRYLISGGNQLADDLALTAIIETSSSNFSEFVELLTIDLVLTHELFMPQYVYLYDRQYQRKVNTVLSFETLASDWAKFSEKVSLPQKLPKVNVNKLPVSNGSEHNLPKLSKAAQSKMMEFYQKDFELLGYSLLSMDKDNDEQ